MPERVQLSRKKGWRIPPGTLVVSRPHWLGNPFRVERYGPNNTWMVVDTGRLNVVLGHGWTRLGAVKFAVEQYRRLIDDQYPEGTTARFGLVELLRGKNLACWCPLDQPCHADVLLQIAGGEGR